MVNLTIDGVQVLVPEGTTILKAAELAGKSIPRLCFLEEINEIGACRMCIVEVEGNERLVPSCVNTVAEGMVVYTDSPRVLEARQINLQLILSQHNFACGTCPRNGTCELQKMTRDLKDLKPFKSPFPKDIPDNTWDMEAPLIRDNSKCIKCMRCIQVCDKIQTIGIWDVCGTGSRVSVNVSHNRAFNEVDCTLCGQCIKQCPVGALFARDDVSKVVEAIDDPEITTIVQVAPAVRSSWAEDVKIKPENISTERMVGALKAMGFDYVFDAGVTGDLAVMEESAEFIERFNHRADYKWPMFTSTCPAWVRFLKANFPEMTDGLATSKSPQQMFGALAKSYFAETANLDPAKIRVVSIGPCVSAKSEAALETMHDATDDPDVDLVLTTREFARLIRAKKLRMDDVEDVTFDQPFATCSGAAALFGASGGIMDATMRNIYQTLTGEKPDVNAFRALRNVDDGAIREATYTIPEKGDVRVAVVSGLGNTRTLMERIKAGKAEYDFVEVLACPGGCVNGGGQPINLSREIVETRRQMLTNLDEASAIRFSAENPDVQALYKDVLENSQSEKAQKLLHTDHQAWEMPPHPSVR